MNIQTATKATLQFLKADHGPALRQYAGIAATVVALVITLATIAADAAYILGRQTREAIEARNDQLASLARTMVEWAEGIEIEFPEISIPTEIPILSAAAGPIALLAPAPARKRTRKPVATAAPARKRQTRTAPAAA